MNSYTSGVAIDPEWPVRNDLAPQPTTVKTAHPSGRESMAKCRAKRRGNDYRQRKGEIPMKQWRFREAAGNSVSPSSIANRLMRGKYPDLKIRRVNKRVVYVST